MIKQTFIVICIISLTLLSGCLKSGTTPAGATSETSTAQQTAPAKQDDSKLDKEDGNQTDSQALKRTKEMASPHGKDRLLEKADFIFDAVTLEEFAKTVSERFDIVVWIDEVALEEIGLGGDALVTVNLEEVTLQTGLTTALKGLGLGYGYDVRESYLSISTLEQLEYTVTTRVYHLLGSVQPRSLIRNIQDSVVPDQWREVAGGGVAVPTVWGGIVISQTDQVHRQITQTFGELLRPVKPGVVDFPKREWAALMAAFAAKTDFDVEDILLKDFLKQLADEHDVKVFVDQNSLDEFGLDASSVRVTANLKGLCWGTVLKLILHQFSLTYMIDSDGELLTVTTYEAAEEGMVPVIYEIADLLTNKNDSEILMDTITSNIDPDTWSDLGGAGVITGLRGQGVITVLQTPATHFKVAQLLADLRQLKE